MTRLGYQIPNFTYPDTTPATLFDTIARQAKEADDSGFDTVLVMDHFYQLAMMGPPEHEMLECYSLLSALARETSKVRLSGLVTGNTYRNPAVLAKTVTTLDIVSDGRGQLGIGAGWFELEHDAFGIEFGTFTDRFEKLEEALQIIIPMLRGEKANLDGKHYQVKDAFNSPVPASRIPVMIGGGGERKTLRMVAQYADESNLICRRDELPRKLDALAGHCEALGRDRSELTVSWQRSVCIAPTMEEAQADVGRLPRHGRRGRVDDERRAAQGVHRPVRHRRCGHGRRAAGQGPDRRDRRLHRSTSSANGHIPGRVTLLGETASKVVFG